MTGKSDVARSSRQIVEAALARQHEIEHDEIEPAARERTARLLAVGDGRRRETVLLEKGAQQRADFAIVVDDENVGRSVHGVATSGSCQGYRPRSMRNHAGHYTRRPSVQL